MLDLSTVQLIQDTVDTIMAVLPERLGVDELIPSCEVISMDTYGVGVGVYPRYITVSKSGREYIPVLYRGGIPGLAINDFVLVIHFRAGNRYEVAGVSGAAGVTAHNTLDDAYDEGGAGTGRTIVADNGAVAITGTDGLQVDNTADIQELRLYDATELTIAAGVITRTQSYHSVDTQNDDPSDNLDTINGGAWGDVLIIRAANDARTVVIKHNTGNIWLIGETDISLEDTEDHISLVYDGAKWCSVGDGGGAGGGGGSTTISFFVPALSASTLTARTRQLGIQLPTATDRAAYGQFTVPENYASDLVVTAVIMADGDTGDIVANHYLEYGACGEAYDNHTDSDTDTLTLGDSVWECVLPITMSVPTAGDVVCCTFYRNGTDGSDDLSVQVLVAGWHVTYTRS